MKQVAVFLLVVVCGFVGAWSFFSLLSYSHGLMEAPDWAYSGLYWRIRQEPEIYTPLVEEALADGFLSNKEWDYIKNIKEHQRLLQEKQEKQEVLKKFSK